MEALLMSIRPKYVKAILSGDKKYEFRKKKCKREVDKMLIYSTNPVKAIVAEAKIIEILENNKELIWQKTKEYAGITKSQYEEYFNSQDLAVAYVLGDIKIYENPKKIEEYGLRMPPQSFVYISSDNK